LYEVRSHILFIIIEAYF